MLTNSILEFPDKWLWDFWLAQDGSDYHLFYLQARKSLKDPEERHWHVSIGHSVSTDWYNWKHLDDAIRPGGPIDPGEYTTWTGSIIRHNKLWYLFYTSTEKSEKGLIQRISLATSKDLIKWEKHPQNPLFCADARYYETLESESWHDEAWRDPWVFQHPDTGEFHVFITGRAKQGPRESRGVIAHAKSTNLVDWQVLPPVTQPIAFGTMECPQLVNIQGRYYLLFSVQPGENVGTNLIKRDLVGTFYMSADNPLGPFSEPKPLYADPMGQLYSGKLVQGPDQQWYFMSWRNLTINGKFLGDLSEPLPIEVDKAGNLTVLSLLNQAA